MILGAKLSHPQGHMMFHGKAGALMVQKCIFLFVFIPIYPVIISRIFTRTIPWRNVIMAAVNQIFLKGSVQSGKISGVIVALQEKYMSFIYFSHCLPNFPVQPVNGIPVGLVEFVKIIGMLTGGRAGGRFVHKIVPGYRAPVPVPLGKFLP